jgi:hypothetical protein
MIAIGLARAWGKAGWRRDLVRRDSPSDALVLGGMGAVILSVFLPNK